jgi:ribosomal protein S18 acetylase RimI-like enzyme
MNGPEWTIRQASVDEIDRLIDLRMAMFEAMDLLDEENRERTRDDCLAYFEATLPTEVFRVWVACALDTDGMGIQRGPSSDETGTREGELIASIGLVIHSIPPSMFNRVGKEGYIMNLVTLPDWRRRGIARALLEHVLAVLRSEAVPIASLHASHDGLNLYEELGFKTKEDLPEMRLPL